MNQVTPAERDIIIRFGWNLVNVGDNAGGGRGNTGMFLTHKLLYGKANMAIPVNLERETLTQAVARAAYSFDCGNWIRNADISKYDEDPMISLETKLRGDAEYALRELKTLCTALGLR